MTASASFYSAQPHHLVVNQLEKKFGQHTALSGISLNIQQGEFVCLLGPSGCGKTTLLRAIAGLERQDRGQIICAGRDISNLPPQARDYGILFQSYALFPNLTVAQNVAYGLSDASRDYVRQRVDEMLSMVGLAEHAKKYPAQLSGGQQQRVALARALAPSPSLLLLDEPMSALDARVREHLCSELRQLQKQLGITTLMVTHNQDEAMLLADRIAVMHQGRIEQFDSAENIYHHPRTPFVAEFVGQGNWLPFVRDHHGQTLIGDRPVHIQQPSQATHGHLFCRPEGITINADASVNQFAGRVQDVTFLGSRCLMHFELEHLPGHALQAELPFAQLSQLGNGHITVGLPSESLRVFA